MQRLNSVLVFSLLLAAQFSSLHGHPNAKNNNLPTGDGQTFDFIVVGGGTSGCAVAARLAESGKHTVLLLEAGGIPIPELDIPSNAGQYTVDPNVVKIYPTVPQLNAGLALSGALNFTIGEMLGGGSGINGMFVNRGSPHDYNNWAKLTGDESWNYSNMLKYFRKYENYSGDYPSDQRGFHGPISIERPSYAPGVPEWLKGGQELGYSVGEPNGPQIMSFTGIDYAHKFGRRVSSYKGYIEPMLESNSTSFAKGRNNLHILINTQVNRIIFEGKQAVGVKFTSNSTHIGFARARKEIVVTAGVIDSAAILLRSGIGPRSILDRAGVPVVKQLPVGRNLHDHIVAFVGVVFGNRSAAFIPERDLTPEAWTMYNEIGDGPYTSYLGSGGQAFLGSSSLSPLERKLGWPDIHLVPLNTFIGGLFGSGDGATNTDIQDWEVGVSWSNLLTRPKSRGSVTLNATNIDNTPIIDFQYLSHPDDLQALIDGLKTLTSLCENTETFRRIGCRVPTTPFPACSHLTYRSDPYWTCYVRQTGSCGLHAGGTCRMGSGAKDPQAVVDTKLRVIGIDGLRVADASIMPAVTNANPQGAVYAIAEKAAEMILNRWEPETHLPRIDNKGTRPTTGLGWTSA